MTPRLFVYGTLLPGETRWRVLAPLVSPNDAGPAAVAGRLYRTPYGWPAAVFDPSATTVVPGLIVMLRDPVQALPVLDEIEGTGTGLFQRRLIVTASQQCWAYHWPGTTSTFQPIPSWTDR